MWASTRWPFSSSTANIVLGSGSITVPSTSIASRLAIAGLLPFLTLSAGPIGTDTRSRSVSKSRSFDQHPASGRRENHGAVVGHGDRMLEVGRQGAVLRDGRPVVGQDAGLV